MDPVTLHHYVYAAGDPINKSDPSGLYPDWLETILIGIGVHQKIGADFITTGTGRLSDRAIITLLRAANNGNDGGVPKPAAYFRVDLASVLGRYAFEIKPVGSFNMGLIQLASYVSHLSYYGQAGSIWRPGTDVDYMPPPLIPEAGAPWVPGIDAVVYPPDAGVILYDALQRKGNEEREKEEEDQAEEEEASDEAGDGESVAEEAETAEAEADNAEGFGEMSDLADAAPVGEGADLEDTVGVATLDSEMGAP
jgi:hypothetical protein